MSSTCGHCGEKAIETTSYGRTHFQNCGKTIGQNKNKKKKSQEGLIHVWEKLVGRGTKSGALSQRSEHLFDM